MGLRSYQELKVWQVGMQIAREAYLLSKGFPKDEIYGLVTQMRRAAVSVPANIAEGHARESTKEFLRFLLVARGSLAELETHVLLAQDLGYCRADQANQVLQKCHEEGRMLRGLQRSLQSRLKSPPSPPSSLVSRPSPLSPES
jgi:four helix bundle protein